MLRQSCASRVKGRDGADSCPSATSVTHTWLPVGTTPVSVVKLVFVSGSEIEFMDDGVWKEIDCRHSAVPMSVVPEKIAAYVQQHFPGVVINKMEKGKHYEVELSNRLDLYFDHNGNYAGFDD